MGLHFGIDTLDILVTGSSPSLRLPVSLPVVMTLVLHFIMPVS